jgi:hypothetical protein
MGSAGNQRAYAFSLLVEVIHFGAAHAIVIGMSLLGALAVFGGVLWRPRATVAVASVPLYALMAFRLFRVR